MYIQTLSPNRHIGTARHHIGPTGAIGTLSHIVLRNAVSSIAP